MTTCKFYVLNGNSPSHYCVDSKPISRHWYRANAKCMSYGGELVLLETSAKMQLIRQQLLNFSVKLSNRLFVNSDRPFYWKYNDHQSSEQPRLVPDRTKVRQCVSYSFQEDTPSSRAVILCDLKLRSIFLICQSILQRIAPMQINYTAQHCEYFTYAHRNVDWYQAKAYCEAINSTLLGVPNKE